MALPSPDDSPALGLLDLSVDLSVPEVFAGTDFTLYLHIKNPFAKRVWIRSVELSLPTQLSWRQARDSTPDPDKSSAVAVVERRIAARNNEIELARRELAEAADGSREQVRHEQTLRRLVRENENDLGLVASLGGAMVIRGYGESQINLSDAALAGNLYVSVADRSTVNISDLSTADPEAGRVPLTGSLPPRAALEPGCTDVWTIRLGSGRRPFFVPAKYRMQLTVIYSLEPPPPENAGVDHTQQVFSNTTATTVPIKAALWSVITGGVVGGVIGNIGRSLQDVTTRNAIFADDWRRFVGGLILSIILSGAGIIFSARRSDAQSFVTVEDFWGGLLVGFLIGYSGTAAFSSITGVKGS